MRTSSHGPGASELESLACDVLYQPTDRERQLKASFWLKVAENPMLDASHISLDTVRHVLNKEIDSTVWARPGFKEWFCNKDEHRERLEYLFSLALDAAEQILMNQEPKAQSARVNMVKTIAELASKVPGKGPGNTPTDKMLKAVNGMDKAQLELFLQREGVNMKLSASKDVHTGQPIITVKTIDNDPSDEV